MRGEKLCCDAFFAAVKWGGGPGRSALDMCLDCGVQLTLQNVRASMRCRRCYPKWRKKERARKVSRRTLHEVVPRKILSSSGTDNHVARPLPRVPLVSFFFVVWLKLVSIVP